MKIDGKITSKKLIPGWIKAVVVLFCFCVSVFGFMIKLPKPFRGMDQELHALFFFVAAAFLNILFLNKKLQTHLLIFGMLFLFSALIEFAQEYSNVFLGKRLHGMFDPEDLKYNLMGLVGFSSIWILFYLPTEFLSKRKAKLNK